MSDIITPPELKIRLKEYLPNLNETELEKLVDTFVLIAEGKYVSGKSYLVEHRNQLIKKLYNGRNTKELSLKFHLSPRSIQRILKN